VRTVGPRVFAATFLLLRYNFARRFLQRRFFDSCGPHFSVPFLSTFFVLWNFRDLDYVVSFGWSTKLWKFMGLKSKVLMNRWDNTSSKEKSYLVFSNCTLGFFRRRLKRRMPFLFLRCGRFSLLGGFFEFGLGPGLRTYIIIFSFISWFQRNNYTHIDAKISSIFSIKYFTICFEAKESILPMPIGEMIST